MTEPIVIGGRDVGAGAPCFVIAEAGSNHDGKLDQALQLVDAAATAGADAVKFQLFRADRLYSRGAGRSAYLGLEQEIFDVIADAELSESWLELLAARAAAHGMAFIASVFDEASADQAEPYVDAFKIASYELTHAPLLHHVAAKGKPIVLSTGASTIEEVHAAVADAAGPPLAVLQCTAAYPAPVDSLDLRVVASLARELSVPIGFSDHSLDPLVVPVAAVAAGAALLEKHFTLSRELPGPDHRFALEPDELRLMVESVRTAETALGGETKTVHDVEQELRRFARRSIFALRDISAGEELTHDNVAVLRAGELDPGLAPRELPRVIGRRARRPIAAETALVAEDVA